MCPLVSAELMRLQFSGHNDQQAEQGLGPDVQQAACRKWAREGD